MQIQINGFEFILAATSQVESDLLNEWMVNHARTLTIRTHSRIVPTELVNSPIKLDKSKETSDGNTNN